VVHGYKFERGQELFKGFVEHFYERKRNNKGTAIGEIAKITLNSRPIWYATFKTVNRNCYSR